MVIIARYPPVPCFPPVHIFLQTSGGDSSMFLASAVVCLVPHTFLSLNYYISLLIFFSGNSYILSIPYQLSLLAMPASS